MRVLWGNEFACGAIGREGEGKRKVNLAEVDTPEENINKELTRVFTELAEVHAGRDMVCLTGKIIVGGKNGWTLLVALG